MTTHKIFEYRGEFFDACACHCHRVDETWKHILPCCDLTYKRYINENGKLDETLLDTAIHENYGWRKKNNQSKAV